MVKLTVKNRHTDEVIVTASHVIEWSIHKDVKPSQWILNIMYFDEGIEQDIRDAMALCEASSKKWKDDLTVMWSDEA